jgi:superfamily II DNA or RNA helicase
LFYTNTVETSILAMKYLDNIVSKGLVSLENMDEFYNKALHSQHSSKTIDMEIELFKQSKLGIISCVYLFGEGFDLPRLNGVCVAENMQSEIRIVQYLLRSNRIDHNHPEKVSFIVLPYMDTDDWETENRSFEKVRKVVSQMRNSDDTIEQKLRVGLHQQTDSEKSESSFEKQFISNELFESLCELERLKLRLRYSKTLKSNYTEEEDEYYYIRSLNESLGVKSEKEYIACKSFHPHYIENAEQYFKSRGVWKGWKDFLRINKSNYMSWNDWKEFCLKKKIMTREEYEEHCFQNPQLPKAPEYVYKGFSNMMTELERLQNKRRGIRM